MDRTKEDIAQDARIAALEAKYAAHERKIAAIDGDIDRIRLSETNAAKLAKELADAKAELAQLEPLKKLAGFADHIHRSLGLTEN